MVFTNQLISRGHHPVPYNGFISRKIRKQQLDDLGVPPFKDTSNPSGLIVVKLDRLRLGIFGWWFHQNTLGMSHGDFYLCCQASSCCHQMEKNYVHRTPQKCGSRVGSSTHQSWWYFIIARLQADHINIHKPSTTVSLFFYWLVLELTDLKLVQAIRFYHPGKEWKTRENDQPDCLQHTCNISNSNGNISQH